MNELVNRIKYLKDRCDFLTAENSSLKKQMAEINAIVVERFLFPEHQFPSSEANIASKIENLLSSELLPEERRSFGQLNRQRELRGEPRLSVEQFRILKAQEPEKKSVKIKNRSREDNAQSRADWELENKKRTSRGSPPITFENFCKYFSEKC